MFKRMLSLCLIANTLLFLSPLEALGFEWIQYQNGSGKQDFYFSDVKSYRLTFDPEFSNSVYLDKEDDYREFHDGITISLMTSFDEYQMGGGSRDLSNISGEKYRYNASQTGFAVSCANLKMSDSATLYFQTKAPLQLIPDDESYLGKSTTIPKSEQFFSTIAFGVFPRLYDISNAPLKKVVKKLCADFYPSGAKATYTGAKPRKPKNVMDLFGVGFRSDRFFKLFQDHAFIESKDKVLIRPLIKQDGFWFVAKYENNSAEYKYDDAFKVVDGDLTHFEYSWGAKQWVKNTIKKSRDDSFGYLDRFHSGSHAFDMNDYSQIGLSSNQDTTLKFMVKEGKCVASGSRIKANKVNCNIYGNRLLVGPFEHTSGGKVEWEILGKYIGSRVAFDVKVVGKEEKFDTLYLTSSRLSYQPPFLEDIRDLWKSEIFVSRWADEPLVTFSGSAKSCRANSKYLKDRDVYCAFTEDAVTIGPFYHVDNKEPIELHWMIRLNELGGIKAFVKSKYTSNYKYPTGQLNGWKGFGDYTIRPKK